jgi:hypothetical protein
MGDLSWKQVPVAPSIFVDSSPEQLRRVVDELAKAGRRVVPVLATPLTKDPDHCRCFGIGENALPIAKVPQEKIIWAAELLRQNGLHVGAASALHYAAALILAERFADFQILTSFADLIDAGEMEWADAS